MNRWKALRELLAILALSSTLIRAHEQTQNRYIHDRHNTKNIVQDGKEDDTLLMKEFEINANGGQEERTLLRRGEKSTDRVERYRRRLSQEKEIDEFTNIVSDGVQEGRVFHGSSSNSDDISITMSSPIQSPVVGIR